MQLLLESTPKEQERETKKSVTRKRGKTHLRVCYQIDYTGGCTRNLLSDHGCTSELFSSFHPALVKEVPESVNFLTLSSLLVHHKEVRGSYRCIR